jgi:probable O-glycosylation ligase (exosortase A-associated)
MRDLAVFLAILACIPAMLRNPFAAFIIWGWTVAISLNYYLYGFMISMRLNLTFAIITLTLIMLGKLKQRQPWPTTLTSILVVWFCIHVSLSAIFAYRPNPLNVEYWLIFFKSMVFCLLIPLVLTTRLRFHSFAIMYGIGLSFHGVVEGLKLIASGGGHRVGGLPGTMMGDNNHLAIPLTMVLPIVFYLYQYSKNRLVKLAFISSFILTIVAIIATQSRGGFIALIAVGAWLIMSSRRKILFAFIAICGFFLIINVAPPSWFSRMETIQTAGDDGSFMGRVIAWKISSAIALSNPIFGGGFHAIQAPDVWNEFKNSQGMLGFLTTPPPRLAPQAAHSIYFEILGDHGILGLVLFLGILISTFKSCIKVREITKGKSDLLWARDLSDMLGVSVMAYAVGGAGVNLGYFEIYYSIVMAVIALRFYVEKQLASRIT